MRAFEVTIGGMSETFRLGADFAEGDARHHWTFEGLEKLIRLGIWQRRLDRRGMVIEKAPAVEDVGRLPSARAVA
jgi:hypothetical protein